MLAKIQVQRLVNESKIGTTLGVENLLPINNNKCFLDTQGITTVNVVEDDPALGAKPVAFGLLNRCTSNQSYCSIVVTSPNYKNNFVTLERVKAKNAFFGLTEENQSHFLLKVANVLEELPDLYGMPQYFSAFAEPIARPLLQCVVDSLVDQTFGHVNFEMARNLTVDLYDASSGVDEIEDKLWRDFSGFVVADRFRYAHIEIARKEFTRIIRDAIAQSDSPSTTTSEGIPFRIEKLTKENAECCIGYDQEVALAMNRQDYLEYIFQLYGLTGAIAFDAQNETIGYVISLGGNILQCYAEEPKIANQLFLEHIGGNGNPEDVILFYTQLGKNNWIAEKLCANALNTRRVRRFHTRVVPTNVKWSKIFAMNTGVHLF